MGTWLPTQAVTMKSFVPSSLFAVGLSAPTTHVNSGLPAGPLTPAFGDAVQTPKGLRSLALEGFSEDLNQDGFVDPIGQAVVAAPVAYTVPHVVSHPVAAVNTAVAPVAYHNVYAAAPVAVKAEADPYLLYGGYGLGYGHVGYGYGLGYRGYSKFLTSLLLPPLPRTLSCCLI